MGVFLISLVVSVVPSIFLYKWLVNSKDDKEFKLLCKESVKKGIYAVFPVVLTSLTLYIIGKISNISSISVILYEAYYTFIVLALAEESVKYLQFKSVLKTATYKYDDYDVVIFMTIVGLGFGIIENVTYSIGTGIITMLISGITLAHAGYGFIVGYFYGKSLKTGKMRYRIIGFLISFILHGLYDFGLSEEVINLNDNLAFISIGLAFLSLITLILLIKYVKKRKKFKI